jgi:hypothetical protein
MTRKLPSTKSKRRLSPEERGRLFAKLCAEISAAVRAECGPEFFPGDYSEAAISAHGAEMGQLFAKWEVEDALRFKPDPAERAPRKPTLASVSKQANKAALDVARYEIKPDGTVVVVTGAAEPQQGNELDKWIKKHAR